MLCLQICKNKTYAMFAKKSKKTLINFVKKILKN